jgi:FkbM family methyltransferase
MTDFPTETTVVFDAGARYGMHPSWNRFSGELRYYGFEPDAEEAARLRAVNDPERFLVYETALDKTVGERPFNVLRHRGISSFLQPKPESECFRNLKLGQAEIEKQIMLKTKPVDAVADELGVRVDFLKIDTEGTEQDVLESAERQLGENVIGARISCNFQSCFHGQRLFHETFGYLQGLGFNLLNIDYFGYGYPRQGLFRKPDPSSPENFRYGTLVSCDGVWLKDPALLVDGQRARGQDAAEHAILKFAYFAFLNNAPDVGVDELLTFVETSKRKSFSDAVKATRLYAGVQLEATRFLGSWRTVPDQMWERASSIYRAVFGRELEGGSAFYPQLQELEARLRAGK